MKNLSLLLQYYPRANYISSNFTKGRQYDNPQRFWTNYAVRDKDEKVFLEQ